jgi:GNAT superfamily N-acetyltransferase
MEEQMPEALTERWTAEQAVAATPALMLVYAAAYAEPPYHKGPADSERFATRLAEHAQLPGFTFIAARTGEETVGFAYGRRFESGQWWYGAETMPSPEIVAAERYAVSELVMTPAHRGRRVATRLMDELLLGRTEPYAQLLSRPGSRAREIYRRWGWQLVGTVRARPELPAADALLLDLRKRAKA